MAFENVRVQAETLDPSDPQCATMMESDPAPEFALKNFRWYVIGTNEPVTFASKDEAQQYLRDRYRVGDFVEINRDWPTFGYITHIEDDIVRVEAPNKTWSWRLDRTQFVDRVMTWRRGQYSGIRAN